jgi:hypothetical protein
MFAPASAIDAVVNSLLLPDGQLVVLSIFDSEMAQIAVADLKINVEAGENPVFVRLLGNSAVIL